MSIPPHQLDLLVDAAIEALEAGLADGDEGRTVVARVIVAVFGTDHPDGVSVLIRRVCEILGISDS